MGSPGTLADVITSASCSRCENRMWCIPVYGRNIPMLSRPGAASSVSSDAIFPTRTMGRFGESIILSSSGVGSV